MLEARMDKTRDTMRRGGLPRPRSDSNTAWVGRGEGASCSGCSEMIEKAETQCEVDFGAALTFTFHRECYQAWMTYPDGANPSSAPR
jgi:hypothetical protein